MKKEIIPSIILSVICLVVFCVIYPAIVWCVAQCAPGNGEGRTTSTGGKKYYTNIGQKFTDDKYFWSRPSAVDYNAAGSGGSNKGPANPEYLAQVKGRIDSFVVHNPGVALNTIPSDIVTASGSGLDPHISKEAALAQVTRVAVKRGADRNLVAAIVADQLEGPMFGMGPERINVLQLNLALDQATQK